MTKEEARLAIMGAISMELKNPTLQQGFEIICKNLAELEKENAELKKQQFSLRNERNTFLAQNEQYERDLADFNENLIKAKDLLKQWLQTSKASGCDNINIVTDTEQFLSEVEK